MKQRDIMLAIFVSMILGSNFVAVKFGVDEMPPLLMTSLRFLLASFPAVFFVKKPNTSTKNIILFGMVFGIIQFGMLFTAVHLGMPAGLSSVVIQMQVFFTVAFAWIWLGERPSILQIIGGSIAALGVASIGLFRAGGVQLLPFLLVLGAACAWGVSNLIAKKAGNINMLSFVIWASLVAPLPLLVLSLGLDGYDAIAKSLTHLSWKGALALAYVAYPTTILAFGMWASLLSRYPAASVTPFALLVPVFGLISTHLILSEKIDVVEIVASLLILVGLAINVCAINQKNAALRRQQAETLRNR